MVLSGEALGERLEKGEGEVKYPILMLHGMGFRDDGRIGYWGRIPKALESAGYKVYYGRQDSSASIEVNARQIADSLEEILKSVNTDKVNIIAHSKGGLEARYLASALGYGDRIASISTLSTPHNGSKTVDRLMRFPDGLIRVGCKAADLWFRLLGDKHPDTYKAINAFKTESAERFNRENPDVEGIYYQSYAFVMRHAWSDMLMWLPSLVVHFIEGENDGLLTPDNARWGEFRGIVRGNTNRGISHCDEVDMRRRPLSRKEGEGIKDITELYVRIANGLEEKGF
ncbi:MAG: triacylglycerol lipase [Butyrivibrio sp.]|nr:hypothetical protein [Muribaculum sp.]MCM1553267.1 triacylglycerol lipase [Butyrivibrio sp.]